MPVAGGGTCAAPSLAFSRNTAICARLTGVSGQKLPLTAAGRDAVARDGVDEIVEAVLRRNVQEVDGNQRARRRRFAGAEGVDDLEEHGRSRVAGIERDRARALSVGDRAAGHRPRSDVSGAQGSARREAGRLRRDRDRRRDRREPGTGRWTRPPGPARDRCPGSDRRRTPPRPRSTSACPRNPACRRSRRLPSRRSGSFRGRSRCRAPGRCRNPGSVWPSRPSRSPRALPRGSRRWRRPVRGWRR